MQRSFPGPSLARDLADDWKSVVFRGVLIALFGLLFLFAPAFSLTVGVYAFAGFALVFGVLALVSGFRTDSGAKWALIIEGIAGIAAGLIAFAWPGVVVVWIAATRSSTADRRSTIWSSRIAVDETTSSPGVRSASAAAAVPPPRRTAATSSIPRRNGPRRGAVPAARRAAASA